MYIRYKNSLSYQIETANSFPKIILLLNKVSNKLDKKRLKIFANRDWEKEATTFNWNKKRICIS